MNDCILLHTEYDRFFHISFATLLTQSFYSIRELILSEEKSVSYFAGGIIANVVYGWTPQFKLQVSTKQELLDKLVCILHLHVQDQLLL